MCTSPAWIGTACDLPAASLLPAAPSGTPFWVDLAAWYDASTFNQNTQSWKSKAVAEKQAFVSGVATLATDAAGTTGSSAPLSFVSGSQSTAVAFPEAVPDTNYSLCTVSRYTDPATASGPTQTHSRGSSRIFQSTSRNWLHGHWWGYTGVAYFVTTWVQPGGNSEAVSSSPNAGPPLNWLLMCSSQQSASLASLLVNGFIQFGFPGVGGRCLP